MHDIIRIPKPGDLVADRFRLVEEIGRGGFGVVYRSTDEAEQGREVAVKMLMPHILGHGDVVERFKREAHLASSLTHPSSIDVYAYGVYKPAPDAQALPYITMELLRGQTLTNHLNTYGRPSVDDTMSILAQALGSLEEAHEKGIVHRDVKPENIFLCEAKGEDGEQVVKVLDYGIARAVYGDWDDETFERLTSSGMVTGTAEYMAPEQASGQPDVTPALDVYAMGCIAYLMVTGHVPFQGKSPMEVAIKQVSAPIPAIPSHLEGHFMAKAIRRAMAKDPKKRFRNAAHFAKALRSKRMTYTINTADAPDYDAPLEDDDHGQNVAIDYAPTVPAVPSAFAEDPIHGVQFKTIKNSSLTPSTMPLKAATPAPATVPSPAVEKPKGPNILLALGVFAGVAVCAALISVLFVGGLALGLSASESPPTPPTAIADTPKTAAKANPEEVEDDGAPAKKDDGDTKAVADKGGEKNDGKDDGDKDEDTPAKEDKAPVKAEDDGDKDTAEADGDEGEDGLLSTVTVESNVRAYVHINKKRVGKTPFEVVRSTYGDKPIKVELRARATRKRIKVDWTEASVKATFR